MNLILSLFVLLAVFSVGGNPVANRDANYVQLLGNRVDIIMAQLREQATSIHETERRSYEIYSKNWMRAKNVSDQFKEYLLETTRNGKGNSVDFLEMSMDFANRTVQDDLISCLSSRRRVFESIGKEIHLALRNGEKLRHNLLNNSYDNSLDSEDLREWTSTYQNSTHEMEVKSSADQSQSLNAMTVCFNEALKNLEKHLHNITNLIMKV